MLVKTIKVKQARRQQPSIEVRRNKLVRTLAMALVQVARNSRLDLPALSTVHVGYSTCWVHVRFAHPSTFAYS